MVSTSIHVSKINGGRFNKTLTETEKVRHKESQDNKKAIQLVSFPKMLFGGSWTTFRFLKMFHLSFEKTSAVQFL